MDRLHLHIESLIFATDKPIGIKGIQKCLKESLDTDFSKKEVEQAISELEKKYQQDEFSFEVREINDGYQLLTKAAFHHTIGTHIKQESSKKLSKAALETLSIIAYKQPVTKVELESIRGVNCDYTVQKLLEKELVTILGRSDAPGRPLLYGTSDRFMDYFGLKSIKDLPKPKDFHIPENQIGESADILDHPKDEQE